GACACPGRAPAPALAQEIRRPGEKEARQLLRANMKTSSPSDLLASCGSVDSRCDGSWSPRYMCTIASGGVVFQRPRVKSGKSTAAALCATDWTLRCTTALSDAAS